MADGSKRSPDPPFDLVLIIKIRCEYRKDAEFRKSSELRNVYLHKWQGLFGLKIYKNLEIYKNWIQNVANLECTACWVPNIYAEIGSLS